MIHFSFPQLISTDELDFLWQRVLRIAIIAGILSACAYVVPRAPQVILLLLLFAVGGMAVSILLLQKPALGPVMLIFACLAVPVGLNSTLHIGMLLMPVLLGLWLLNCLIRYRAIDLVQSRPLVPLLLLTFVAILSFSAGQLPWFPVRGAPLDAQIGGLSVYIFSAGAFLLVVQQVRTLRWLQAMVWTFTAIGSVYIVSRAVPGLEYSLGRLFARGSTGSLLWVWLVVLPFSQALFNGQLSKPVRAGLFCLVIVTFYVAFVQGGSWKSGWVPPLAAVMAIIGVRWRQVSIIGAGLAMGPAAGIAAKIIATDEYSYFTRVEAWRVLLNVIEKNPILGVGPANYYWYTPLFPLLGYYVPFNSHSQYVDLVAQTGIVGLLCFFWFAWELGWLGWRLLGQAPEGFARAFAFGAFGGLVGTVVAGALGDWVLPFVYNVGLPGMRASLPGWMLLGGLVALEQMVRQRIATNKES